MEASSSGNEFIPSRLSTYQRRAQQSVGEFYRLRRVGEARVELQNKLLHSYMDLNNSSRIEVPGLQIEKALLPSLCSIKDVRPEVVVIPGQAISIQIKKTTRWEIPENVVDEEFAILTKEARRLALAFQQIESSLAVDDLCGPWCLTRGDLFPALSLHGAAAQHLLCASI